MTLCAQRDAWLDGTLKPENRAAFETHLPSCAECSAAVNAWESFRRGLSESHAAMNAPVSQAQVTRLLAHAQTASKGMGRVWVPVSALVVAAVVLVWVGVFRKEEAAQVWEANAVASVEATVSPGAAETRENGRALLDIGIDRVGLASSTQVEINRSDSRATRISLKRGTVAARVDPARGKRDFTVSTPLGEVHVVGTEFRVSARQQGLIVDVLRGEVEVKPLGGATVHVTAGQRFAFEKGAPRFEVLEVTAFSELERDPAVAPVEVADAGVIEDPKGEAADAGRPTVRPGRVTAPIAQWRQRAARGECAQVTKEAKRFVVAQPQEAAAWLVIGDCQRRSSRFADAVNSYLEAGQQQGSDADAGLLLAASVLQDQLKQPARALKLLEALVARNPSDPVEAAALVRQARAHKALGRKAKSRAILERVVTQFADTPSAAEAARLLHAK